MAHCESCQAAVVWAVTTKGKRIPVDPTPAAAGNIRLTTDTPPVAEVVGSAIDLLNPDDDGTRYTSHFATCPHAGVHRKGRAR